MIYSQKPASKRINIYDSEVGTETRNALVALEEDPTYKTEVAYTANRDIYPEGTMPFVEKHLLYLHQHPHVQPGQYLSNLRLQLRIR